MICLTFDIEEFDTPLVDHKVEIPLRKQLAVSREGTTAILDMLQGMGVKATFFVTGVFAENNTDIIGRMVNEGHEIASHSYCHTNFREGDYKLSKEVLEKISGREIVGYRAPRMAGADTKKLKELGYQYDSSTNPCLLPGKYNNFKAKREVHKDKNSITEIPASVATPLRIPLFWLSLHLMPINIYIWLCTKALKKNRFLNIYFHPWEFSNQIHNQEYKMPIYIRKNAGEKLILRLATVIDELKNRGHKFGTMRELIEK